MLSAWNSPRKPAQKEPSFGVGQNMAIVAGIVMMEFAKMIGITPVMFTLIGRFDD